MQTASREFQPYSFINLISMVVATFPAPVPHRSAGFFLQFEPEEMPEKSLETITLHVPESLKRDLQDLALSDNRSVSEYIRYELSAIVYGRLAAKEAAGRFGERR